MNYRSICICALVFPALAVASAQTRTTMTGTCGKPETRQSVPAGDQQGHAFLVVQGACSITGSVNGAIAKQGNFAEEVETTPTTLQNRGIYVVTFDSGDKVYYKYQGSATMKDGVYEAGTNKYEIAGGTGKMQGITGSGGCKLTGKGDDTLDYSCTGDYSMGHAIGSRSKGRTTPATR